MACSNAAGNFLLPYCICKGKRKKNDFEDGMPLGSRVTVNETSGYVTTVVFMDWLKNLYIPRKEVLLMFEGHRLHSSDINVLDFDAENDATLSLPDTQRIMHSL